MTKDNNTKFLFYVIVLMFSMLALYIVAINTESYFATRDQNYQKLEKRVEKAEMRVYQIEKYLGLDK